MGGDDSYHECETGDDKNECGKAGRHYSQNNGFVVVAMMAELAVYQYSNVVEFTES